MEKSIPPFQRYARSKGIPALGSGAIYPVPESDIVVPDFEIPALCRAPSEWMWRGTALPSCEVR